MIQHTRAFTLIELLVALAIFAVISVLSLRAVSAAIDNRAQIEEEARKWRELGRLFAAIEADLAAVLAASGTSLTGAASPATADGAWLAFARASRGDDDESTVVPQGVRYQLNGGHIERASYHALRPLEADTPLALARFPSNVRGLQLRYLAEGGNWLNDWSAADGALPRALDIHIELASGERVRRVFLVR